MKSIVHCLISLAIAALVVPAAIGKSSILTQDYDMARSGANLGETILAPSNVSTSSFGRLFSFPVDEEVWAQPLYVPSLLITGGSHNVVFVATMGNSVYAFDADNPATSSTPLWSVNLGTPVPSSKFDFTSVGVSRSGIYSTPVIDPSSSTIYAVTLVWSTASQSVSMVLHALDLTTGNEKFGSPVQIVAPGFNADVNEQQAGLLLLNGVIYVPFGSHGDIRYNVATQKGEPYYGMVLAYDAETLALIGSFNAEAHGLGAAIWQGGRGLASDGTYVYAMTANAFKLGTADYSESFVQLHPRTLSVAGFYQNADAACLNALDLDLASSGPQVIPGPGTKLLIGGGKEGKVFTFQLNQALHMQTPKYFWGTSTHPILPAEGGTCVDPRKHGYGWLQGSDTAFWNNPSGNSYYYSFGSYDQLMSWQVSGDVFTQMSADTQPNLHPNAIALSANGGANGILWTVAAQITGLATMSAYNAVPSGGHLTMLWNTTQVPKRDALGALGRYSVPTVVNGKVYVGTGSNQVVVYGTLPKSPAVQLAPASPTLNFTANGFNAIAESIYVNSVGGYTGTVTLTLTGLPAGVTYSFNPATVTLSAKNTTVTTALQISPATAFLPLNDNYTVLVQGSAAGGITADAPIRLLTRDALFSSATKVGCNSSGEMSASLGWQIGGSEAPSIWIQDPTTPIFPGRLWIENAPAAGTATTDYSITNNAQRFLYWAIDQSKGIPANFDNALGVHNVGPLYSCP